MKFLIQNATKEAAQAAEYLNLPHSQDFINKTSLLLANCFETGGKVLIAGNGGSLCDAMHFAEELTGQFRKKRRPLAAIAFSDPAHMSCTANDMGFEEVFSRLVNAYGKPGDVFISLTTSGSSRNLVLAHQEAKRLGLQTISFLGKTGGELLGKSDLEWIVKGFANSDRIQEAHMAAIHIILEALEYLLFYSDSSTPAAIC